MRRGPERQRSEVPELRSTRGATVAAGEAQDGGVAASHLRLVSTRTRRTAGAAEREERERKGTFVRRWSPRRLFIPLFSPVPDLACHGGPR